MKFIRTDIFKKLTIVILVVLCTISSAKAYASPQEADYSTSKTGKELYCHYIDRVIDRFDYDFYPNLDLLVQAIIEVESGFNTHLTSSAGCVGLMQISTYWQADRAAKYGVTNLYDPYDNILVGLDLLHDLYFNYANQDMVLTLMMYNMDMLSARRIRAKGEMTDYARKVFRIYSDLEWRRDNGRALSSDLH